MQQDTALAAILGITHAERNGHHYVDGFGPAPDARGAGASRPLIPELYRPEGRPPRPCYSERRAADRLAARPRPGFASGAEPDWATLEPLDADTASEEKVT